MSDSKQKEIVDAVARQLKNKDLSQQAVMVLQKATARVLERIKQNVDAQLKEDSAPIVDKFVNAAATKMSAMTQQWSDGVRNELAVFPEGTRYIWRDGARTTIIVEQQPQVRHINYCGRMHFISIPYVQFIISFANNKLQTKLYVTCTKKPISDVDQAANYLPLGNIDPNHLVCMGDFKWPHQGTMTEVVNYIIGNFWQSQFSYDHGGFMKQFLTSNFKVHENESELGHERWADATKDNALFATEKTTKYTPGATFRRFLGSDDGDNKGSQTIVNNLKQEILKAIGEIGGDVQSLLSQVDLATENREKAHVETLQEILKEIIVQAYAELWEYLQKQLVDERAVMQKEMQEVAVKLKDDFTYYLDQKVKVW